MSDTKSVWRVRWLDWQTREELTEFLSSEADARQFPHTGSTILDVIEFRPALAPQPPSADAQAQAFKELFEWAKGFDSTDFGTEEACSRWERLIAKVEKSLK